MVNLQNIKVKANSSFQTVCPFPVGFVYSSMNSTSPASTFGGSWTEIKGRFPYFNSSTATGGSNTVTLTVEQMPRHLHQMNVRTHATGFGNLAVATSADAHNLTTSWQDDGGGIRHTGGVRRTTTCQRTSRYTRGTGQRSASFGGDVVCL